MRVRGVLEDIATVAQLSGLHAIMLIALAMRLLRIMQCEAECAKLEECMQKLGTLLQWPLPTGREVAPLQLTAMVTGALVEADGLVGSYHGSTLWCRVRTSRRMEKQLRDMQDRVNCLCVFMLCVHANLLTDHSASDTNAMNHHVNGDPLHGAETCGSASGSKRYNGTGQGGADNQSNNTEPSRGADNQSNNTEPSRGADNQSNNTEPRGLDSV